MNNLKISNHVLVAFVYFANNLQRTQMNLCITILSNQRFIWVSTTFILLLDLCLQTSYCTYLPSRMSQISLRECCSPIIKINAVAQRQTTPSSSCGSNQEKRKSTSTFQYGGVSNGCFISRGALLYYKPFHVLSLYK